MKFAAIVLEGDEISEKGYKNLISSTKHKIERSNAITPDLVDSLMEYLKIQWNYPWEHHVFDNRLNILKTPYTTKEKKKRIACALSHFNLWSKCALTNEAHVILEHDAIFLRDINFELPEEFDIIGLNDPRGATRLSHKFHNAVQLASEKFIPVPIIDDIKIPQGLAGNSAYIIKPSAAKYLIALVKEEGLWPNDAIMCRQLVPKIGVSTTYYTRVQGLQSTTSL